MTPNFLVWFMVLRSAHWPSRNTKFDADLFDHSDLQQELDWGGLNSEAQPLNSMSIEEPMLNHPSQLRLT